MNSKQENKTNAIIVVGSGLSDSGVLNFAKNDLLSYNVEDIVESLESSNQLERTLEGIDRVIWYGIGQTIAPQEDLTEGEIIQLKKIYQEILIKKGIKDVVFDDIAMALKPIEDNDKTVKPTNLIPIIEIPASELSFGGDDWHITDENKARTALLEVFNYAKKFPSKKITVTGYMAPNVCIDRINEMNTALAGKRANTVKSFLEDNGVENPIETANGGVFDKNVDACTNRIPDEGKMSYRRKVRIEFK